MTTKHLDLSEDKRLELAFNNETKLDFNPITFLTKFANYGVTKIHEVIVDTDDVELLEQMMVFLNSTYESGADILDEDLELEELEEFG